MTLVQMQPRPTSADPVHDTRVEARDAAGPQVCDDMSDVSCSRPLGALPVVEGQGSALGVPACSR
ncbi:hypothetical protein ABZ837_41790 [Streptomyces sp. NPDC047197]|uniref:hypothetical protein n=1 Tax=Streptomyces sp. NPDC047197 TaxID=3155477 RepID=UPI0033F4D884